MTWAQNALDPVGPQASRIAHLAWVFFSVAGVVYTAVVVVLLIAIVRSVRHRDAAPEDEPRKTRIITGAVGVTAAIVLGLLVFSVASGRQISHEPARGSMTIQVTGHQWWWEIEYPDQTPSNTVYTANELHIPTGRKVLIRATASDVIHSFWVPNLHGKKDLIPGRINTTWIQADQPGVWRGQCAEFCGLQHAHMGLLVIAESPEQFNAWLTRQREPAAAPSTDEQRRGQQIVENGPCALCHSIRGTSAMGQVAPDLTHLGSRRTIAAGVLANNRGNLGGWITDSHRVKPGVRMPPIPIASKDLTPLLSYLENLK
jgi:cytochrome c oxidase subunit II